MWHILVSCDGVVRQFLQQVVHVVVIDLYVGHKHGILVVVVHAGQDGGVTDSLLISKVTPAQPQTHSLPQNQYTAMSLPTHSKKTIHVFVFKMFRKTEADLRWVKMLLFFCDQWGNSINRTSMGGGSLGVAVQYNLLFWLWFWHHAYLLCAVGVLGVVIPGIKSLFCRSIIASASDWTSNPFILSDLNTYNIHFK